MGPRKSIDELEDWDLFILRHQKTANVSVHFISALLFWLSPIAATFISPWYLIGFFLSGLPSTLSHFIFKDGVVDAKEATSSFQVVYFSSWMAVLFVLNKWSNEVALSRSKFAAFCKGEIGESANLEMVHKLSADYRSAMPQEFFFKGANK